MKKTLICATALTFLACVAFTGSAFADNGPADITLESTIDKAKKAKPAVFPHAAHQTQKDMTCGTCHHGAADGKQVAYTEGMKIEKCESCHNKAAGMPKKVETFKAAAHANCKGCHSATAKADPSKAAIKKCGACHPKKK